MGGELSRSAKSQYETRESLTAARGSILAKDASPLAVGEEKFLIFASIPELSGNLAKTSEKLAENLISNDDMGEVSVKQKILDEKKRISAILTRKDVTWVPIKNKVDREIKEKIEGFKIPGLGFETQEARAYPEASSSAHILGFVGKNEGGEDVGYFGLEGHYDLALSAKPGYVSRESDAYGAPLLTGLSNEVNPVGGVDLITHIDKRIQILAEERLVVGMQKYGAPAGVVIIADPATGAILASASYPSYDPAKYSLYSDELFKNPAVSFSFEPGSIFKLLVMAAAIDSGVITPETKCDICARPLRVDKYVIRTWNDTYRPDSTMTDVLVNSDNVGMAAVAQKLGADKLFDYLTAFGIGKPTGIDLQGEASPPLRERGTWSIVDVSTAGFGQGVAVTPIQIVKAVSTLARGGTSVTPQVVDRIRGEGWEEDIKPLVVDRVVSKKASQEVTAMMVEAAKKGEAKWTHLSGFKVAGKTGTAQIPIAGHYDSENTIASFVGFAPADKPRFVMLTILREPASSPWASETAAPLWYSIAKDLFVYFGIQPEN